MLNDLLRAWLALWIRVFGHALRLVHRRRIASFPKDQAALRRRYGIQDDTPVRPWGPEVEASVVRFAASSGARYATTSGTTARPKRIAYPASRLRAVKWVYSDAFCRMFAALGIRHTSLYVFSALIEDGSLTGMMLEEKRLVPYLSGLQAPYRVHAHPAMQALAREYGSAAARFFVLALANPGVLYATNPSTLAQFFERLTDDWPTVRRLAADFVADPGRFDPIVRKIAGRIASADASERLALATRDEPPSASELLPSLEAFCCWDGGYVRPFLDRVRAQIDARHIPMYSMSTEVVETIPHFEDDEVRFVPMAPGVLYELLPVDADDDPKHLLPSSHAEVGVSYTLVVSDAYGLVRYQTADVFSCVGRVGALPDLRFERRRGLAHSFTGEKITGAQLEAAYENLDLGAFSTCIPHAAPEPRYELVVVGRPVTDDLAKRFDEVLGEINEEYASKRKSGRLAPPFATSSDLESLVARIGGGADWESQMKLLPLSYEVQKRPPNTTEPPPPSAGTRPTAMSGTSSGTSQ